MQEYQIAEMTLSGLVVKILMIVMLSILLPTPTQVRAVSLALLLALTAVRLSAANTTSSGGSQPLPLGQTGLGLRYMIATQGSFPSNGGGGPGAGFGGCSGEVLLSGPGEECLRDEIRDEFRRNAASERGLPIARWSCVFELS